MVPETLFLSNLPLIERIIKFVARRNRLSPADADDLSSAVKLKLIDNDYELLRNFDGRASLSTYLTTVITRLFLQYRVAAWGKWRPSVEARRLGDMAVTLERLIYRDGYTLEEAVHILVQGDPSASIEQLTSIYSRLPLRAPRPSRVDEAASHQVAINDPDPLEAADRRSQAVKIGSLLTQVMDGLDAEDRLILRMRYFEGMRVVDIASAIHSDPKKLYRRINRIMARLRQVLAEQQIDGEVVTALLSAGDVDVETSAAFENVRTIKSAQLPGIYIEPATARRTLEELRRESGRRK